MIIELNFILLASGKIFWFKKVLAFQNGRLFIWYTGGA